MSLAERLRELGIPDYDDDEVALVEETIGRLQPSHVFEWGTNAGASARMFLEGTRRLGAQVHSIDHRKPGGPCAERPKLYQGYWVAGLAVWLYQQDGLPFTLHLCKKLKPKRTLVFIDDSHLLLENARALKMLRREQPAAVILVHDADTGEPRCAIDWFIRKYGDEYEVVSVGPMTRLWPRLCLPASA